MAGLTCEVVMPRRSAKATVHSSFAKKLGLTDTEELKYEEYDCFVLFTGQESDGDETTPVFVCEFLNGRVGNVYTESVRFVDTEEGILIG